MGMELERRQGVSGWGDIAYFKIFPAALGAEFESLVKERLSERLGFGQETAFIREWEANAAAARQPAIHLDEGEEDLEALGIIERGEIARDIAVGLAEGGAPGGGVENGRGRMRAEQIVPLGDCAGIDDLNKG